jgi:hypothetical protein
MYGSWRRPSVRVLRQTSAPAGVGRFADLGRTSQLRHASVDGHKAINSFGLGDSRLDRPGRNSRALGDGVDCWVATPGLEVSVKSKPNKDDFLGVARGWIGEHRLHPSEVLSGGEGFLRHVRAHPMSRREA